MTMSYHLFRDTSLLPRQGSTGSIIRHLKLTFEAARPPPLHNVHQELLIAAEEQEEYF